VSFRAPRSALGPWPRRTCTAEPPASAAAKQVYVSSRAFDQSVGGSNRRGYAVSIVKKTTGNRSCRPKGVYCAAGGVSGQHTGGPHH
jgi:hypothetical protein